MHRQPHAAPISLALLAASALAASGATAGTPARTVNVKLINYRVSPSVRSAASGRVTFVVHNADGVPHNLVVLRTGIAPRSLPVTGEHGRAREIGRKGSTAVLHDEQTVRLSLTLPAGRYLLICNVPGHYQRGMVVAFRVRG
jgi:uncharacterized cupredoxin-like copper-binding protein